MNKNKIVQKHIKGMQKHARKQQLRAARQKSGIRTNIKKPRLKKISPNNWDDWDEIDELDTYQPILSKYEQERRREIEKTIQQGTSKVSPESPDSEKLGSSSISNASSPALVVEAGSGLCRVDQNGEIILCDIRGNVKDAVTRYVNPVPVGDRVLISKNGSSRGVVETVLPRHSVLARPYSPNQGKILDDLHQIVVANVDRLLIVTSWREPYIWPALIDRYLIASQRNKIEPVICINKVDLIEDQEAFDETIHPYKELGYSLILTSTVSGVGINQLRALLRDSTTVLVGLSGVGKSSLLRAVQPSLQLKVGTVSKHGLFTGQGRHTTTQSNLIKLDNGGVVIDTPGVRTFGLAGIGPSDLSSWYPEMVKVDRHCRYGNCTHTNEPNCAVRSAVSAGSISDLRYKNYTQILEELSA